MRRAAGTGQSQFTYVKTGEKVEERHRRHAHFIACLIIISWKDASLASRSSWESFSSSFSRR